MMATLLTVQDVLEAVETDLPDAVLQRLLDAAEADVRLYATATQLALLPATLRSQVYTVRTGQSDGTITLPASIRTYPVVRVEGTVLVGGEVKTWQVDTSELATGASGTASIVPAPDGQSVAGAAFTLTVDSTGKILTVDSSAATTETTITRLLGLQLDPQPAGFATIVMDLVRLAIGYDGLQSERTGQHATTSRNYHDERARVLGRVVWSSGDSLLAASSIVLEQQALAKTQQTGT